MVKNHPQRTHVQPRSEGLSCGPRAPTQFLDQGCSNSRFCSEKKTLGQCTPEFYWRVRRVRGYQRRLQRGLPHPTALVLFLNELAQCEFLHPALRQGLEGNVLAAHPSLIPRHTHMQTTWVLTHQDHTTSSIILTTFADA